MKTLLLTRDFPPDRGGMARLYGELAARMPAGGVEVSTVARRGDGTDPPGVPVVRQPFDFGGARVLTNVLRWTRWTRRRLAAGDIAVLQVGNIRPTGYVAAWAAGRRVPFVVFVHGKDVWIERRRLAGSARRRRAGRMVLGRAAAVVANSRATADYTRTLLAELGLPDDGRVRVVHPGTDPARFRPDPPGADRWRTHLAAGGEAIILTVARLMPRKGIDTVLAALAGLGDLEPAPVYAVAGTGPDRDRLLRLAAELRVADRVRFLGDVDDAELPALYAAADVFILAAREEPRADEVEGFGIVFCEAAAAGRPVIAGASGGVADAVRDGETALLVPPGDAAAVAAALRTLLGDHDLRRRLGTAGRRAVEGYYNWDRAAAEVWRVLEDVARR